MTSKKVINNKIKKLKTDMFKVYKKFKKSRIILLIQSSRLIIIYCLQLLNKSQKRQTRTNYETLKRKHKTL